MGVAMINKSAVLAALASLALAACGGGGGGDPLQEQLRADSKRAESESSYDVREGFVSRWEYEGRPMFASCFILSFKTFRNAKIYPHGGTAVSIGFGKDFRDQAEWRRYCSSPMSGADGTPIGEGGAG